MDAAKPLPRPPLTRERILLAAVELADRAGLSALTMRRLGAELGVEAMSLYKHVANKGEILDGIVELVIAEIELPKPGADWQEAMTMRAISARDVLARHSWAVGLLEQRGSTGPSSLRYRDAIIGSLRSAGFTIENAAHAFWLLDNLIYGQVVQETSFSLSGSDTQQAAAEAAADPDEYPHLFEMEQDALTSDYSFDKEFAFGLQLILDALDRLHESADQG